MNSHRKNLVFIFTFLFFCIANSNIAAQIFQTLSRDSILFEENFESQKDWKMYEEIPNNKDSIYFRKDRGEIARAIEERYSGSHSLRVWSNKANSKYSNHVIAGNKFLNDPINCHYVYSLSAYIPAYSDTGQTGPEFSVQNTKEFPDSVFLTYTAGIQYVPNPHAWDGDSMKKWQIWIVVNKDSACWEPFLNYTLKKGRWYYFELEFKYSDTDSENNYISFKIKDTKDKMDTVFVDLSHFKIAGEKNKPEFKNEGVSLTLEAENLFTFATRATKYKVYYDDVRFIKRKDSSECKILMPSINLDKYFLYQNYPNPFNPETTISYELPKSALVSIEIYDITGRLVETLMNGKQSAGKHTLKFSADRLSSGVYFYRLTADKNLLATKKMIVLK